MSAITITFGNRAEDHVGMQILGDDIAAGLTPADLAEAKTRFEALGCECDLVDLVAAGRLPAGLPAPPQAAVLVVRGGVDALICEGDPVEDPTAALFAEQSRLDPDRKYFDTRRGKVLNKHARWNLCFDEAGQEPDYEAGRGRVVAYRDVPLTSVVREALPRFFGELARGLYAEGNYYYRADKCGIGFHGDGERRIVIACRLGVQIPLEFQWWYRSRPVGDRISLEVPPGSVYAFSEAAVGREWRSPSKLTLRHAAGAPEFLK